MHEIDFSQALSGYVPGSPVLTGATWPKEQVFCEWFGENAYRGNGEIVELGPWLGSLTIPLAKGLSRNTSVVQKNNRLHVFDRFIWDELMESWVGDTEYAGRVAPGADFRFLYNEIVNDFSDHLVVNKSDLSNERWNEMPIEFLLNDATKTLGIVSNVVRQFFPKLIPETSHVAHQDYLWFTEAYVPICMYRLRDYFAHAYSVPDSNMVLFRTLDSIPPPPYLDFQFDYKDLEPAEIYAAGEWNRSILDESDHVLIRAGSAWILSVCGDLPGSRALFEEIESDLASLSIRYQFQRSVLQSMALDRTLDLASIPWCFSNLETLPDTTPNTGGAIRYFDFDLGWIWTTVDSYPVFRSDKLDANLAYQIGTESPRVFKNLTDGSIVRTQCSASK